MSTGFDIFAAVFATNALPGGVAATGSQEVAPSRTAFSRNTATTNHTTEDGTSEDSASLLPGSAAVRLYDPLDRAGSSPGAIDGFDGRGKPKPQ